MPQAWWSQGVRFQCQQSGKCCVSRGEYGFVYLTREDRRQLAQHFGLDLRKFTGKYCGKTDGEYHLKPLENSDDCIFLVGKQCGVYEARPTQCRTWPFWPEHMGPKSWKKEVASFCPGVGKGPVIAAEDIRATLDAQEKADGEP